MPSVDARLEAINLRLSSLEDKSELVLFFFSPFRPAEAASENEKLDNSLEATLDSMDKRLLGLENKLVHMLSCLSASRSRAPSRVAQVREEVQKSRKRMATEGRQVELPLLMPKGMASGLEVTEIMRRRQRQNPEQWTMTIQQWSDVINHCKSLPAYKQLKDAKGRVSMYDLNSLFVIPWSRGTGCSISVLMTRDVGESANLMISHAWTDDTEELQQSVLDYVSAHGIPLSANLWFCVFANYQPEDAVGPSLREQLELEPFARVISSNSLKHIHGGFGVIAVHTAQGDLYTRLWCVHEVERAVAQSGVTIGAAMSREYEQNVLQRVELLQNEGATLEQCLQAANVVIKTSKAVCGSPADEQMLVRLICAQPGGFDAVDHTISDFQKNTLPIGVFRSLIASGRLKLKDASPAARADQQLVLEALRIDLNSVLHISMDLMRDPEIFGLFRTQCKETDQNGNTMLHIAAQNGNDSCIRILAEADADLEAKTTNGSAPLHCAIHELGGDACIRTLAELGADLQARNSHGETALHLAAERNLESCIKVLLELSADIEAADHRTQTALHVATVQGNVLCIEVLAKLGANLDARSEFGNTALHIAAETGRDLLIKSLLELRAGVETKNDVGDSALHIAARHGNDSCIKVLTKLGADFQIQNNNGESALDIATNNCTEAAALQSKIVTVALLQAITVAFKTSSNSLPSA